MSFIGCGGGDGGLSSGGSGGDSGTTDAITISLTSSSNDVSKDAPATVTATVMQGSSPLSGVVVTFTIDNTNIANFYNNDAGTVSTDSNGVAEIEVIAGGQSGAIEIVATVSTGESSNALGINSAGDGNSGDTPSVDSISLFADSQQIASSGADEVVLTVVVKDSSNNLVPAATVTFEADSGSIQVTKAITEADGKATAILRTDAEPSLRTINVTASSDSVSDSLSVDVIGTTVKLTGSSALALNDSNTFIINLLDSDGKGIAESEVTLTLSNSGGASIDMPTSVVTDSNGQASFDVTGTSGGTNTLIASSLGASTSQTVSVQADSFLFTLFNNGNGSSGNPDNFVQLPDVFLSDNASVSLTWLRDGAPVPDGTEVKFTSTRGALVEDSATTVDGIVTAQLSADNAGKTIVTFTGIDGDIQLSNQLEFEFVAEEASTIVAQASPNSIGPDGDTSTISVVVRDSNYNLVKSKTIKFNLTDTSGGTIFPATAVTDSSGRASTIYTSNSVSAQDAVVEAVVVDSPAIKDTVEITIADRELFIAIGTGNDLEEGDDGTTYTKKFVAFVTDADSNPVKNQSLTISAVPDMFYKGQWVQVYKDPAKDEFISWVAVGEANTTPAAVLSDWDPKHACPNEDDNLNGILDAGEDTNGNGLLTPGNVLSSVAAVSVNGDDTVSVEAITDDQGKVVIDLIYPQSFGHWVDINLIVSGAVEGTESFTQSTFTLPVLADDVLNEDVSPPTANTRGRGPFGLTANCSTTD
jgi:hypothetical protein